MATSTPNRTVESPSSTETPPKPKTSSDGNLILVPSHSRWFSWDSIHECEIRNIPESSKNPRVYKYYRNSIVKFFRFNPNRKITFTDVRKTLVGDVGSIRRVFDFLEDWGLINYHPSSSLSKSEAASNSTESPSLVPANEAKRI
ncbi:putative transcription regulator Homeodomain-LIKE family [Medicago truncatula]|uniref:Putative transcription regulator Homeodomain-LIKE family n=1 Tax=Medicago truncatula TaxID=3880 RepID=A0A396HE94_MEDTR|nr:putative transcription regulator Homeodomain-LIKE family [Medicago truncatula]